MTIELMEVFLAWSALVAGTGFVVWIGAIALDIITPLDGEKTMVVGALITITGGLAFFLTLIVFGIADLL